jgi:hypothetical protein
MREHKLIRISDEDDPNRCQSSGAQGQCPYLAAPGLKFCDRHKGRSDVEVEKQNLRNYRLTKFRAQIEQKADSGAIKSLREEIGITRQVLETIINRCEDDTDLMINSNKISDLVLKIEKLVSSCHRLEKSTGQLLDRSAIIQVAGLVVGIVSEYVDESVQAEISERLIELINDVEVVDDES